MRCRSVVILRIQSIGMVWGLINITLYKDGNYYSNFKLNVNLILKLQNEKWKILFIPLLVKSSPKTQSCLAQCPASQLLLVLS